MKLPKAAFLIVFLLAACSFVSGPTEQINLSETSSLTDLSGLYANNGDPDKVLSQILFGHAPIQYEARNKTIDHKDITHIAVYVAGNAVTVRAIKNDCYEYEQAFVEGEDFEITDGEIVLRRHVALLSRGTGDPLVGPSYEKIAITLEKEGHGIYRSQVYAGGLVFLLVPVAFKGLDEVRFRKVASDLDFAACSGQQAD